jgi:hypothetical protein
MLSSWAAGCRDLQRLQTTVGRQWAQQAGHQVGQGWQVYACDSDQALRGRTASSYRPTILSPLPSLFSPLLSHLFPLPPMVNWPPMVTHCAKQ